MTSNDGLGETSSYHLEADRATKGSGQQYRVPVTFRPIEESLDAEEKFRENFPAYVEGLVESVPGGYVTTPMFAARAGEVHNLKPRPDDVYVVTFPKAGELADLLS